MKEEEKEIISDIFAEELDKLSVLCERGVYIDDHYTSVEEAVIKTVQRYLILDGPKPVLK